MQDKFTKVFFKCSYACGPCMCYVYIQITLLYNNIINNKQLHTYITGKDKAGGSTIILSYINTH